MLVNLNQWGSWLGATPLNHFNKMVKRDYKKKEKGVPHMLARRRHCLDYSEVYIDVTEYSKVMSQKDGC